MWFVALLYWLVAPSHARDGQGWISRGPVGEVVGNDIAHAPGRVAAVDDDGAVWVSEDRGRLWERRLAPASDRREEVSEESVRLDAEVRIDELLGDIGEDPDAAGGLLVDESEEGLEEALAEQESAIGQITEALQDTLQADAMDAGFFSQVSGVEDDHPRARVRWVGEELMVGRIDGLWVIAVDGSSERLISQTVTAIGASPAGEVMAGTLRGLQRRGGRRGSWETVEGGPPGVVFDLTHDGAGSWWAACADGLWRIPEDGGEPEVRLDGLSLLDVASDGDGKVWVTDGVRLWRADGEEAVVMSNPATDALVDLDVVDGALRLLTPQALWTRPAALPREEWVPVSLSLEAGASPVAMAGPLEEAWVVTSRGVWWRSAGIDRRERGSEVFVPMPALLEAATRQTGLRARMGIGKATQAVRWLVPEIVLEVLRVERPRLVSTLDRGLALDDDGYTQWMVRAVWRPPSREVAFVNPEDLVVSVDEGETNVYSGAFDDGVLVARQARSAVRDGARRTSTIVSLAQRRAELVASRQEAEEDDLRAQVRLELGIAEIEATLDALTEGAVHRWKEAQASGGAG